MTIHHDPGKAAVCLMSDLSPLEQRLVLYIRLWSDGQQGQSDIWNDLVEGLGPTTALIALQNLESLLRHTVVHARRPLNRHAAHCPCVGGDECILARFVSLATEGAREDAILMATLIVRADVSLGLVRIAEELGLTLMRETGSPVFSSTAVH